MTVSAKKKGPQVTFTKSKPAPVSQSVTVKGAKPSITQVGDVTRIRHRELISGITNSVGVTLSPVFSNGPSIYQVNPLCANLFPWLARIAANYDAYRFHKVQLIYIPTCSTATSGRLLLGYDPDSQHSIPAERQALSNVHCSVEAQSYNEVRLECKLTDPLRWYYTTSANTLSVSEAYLDQGQVYNATWNGADTSAIGEWYVVYDVSLKYPQPPDYAALQAYGNAASILSNFSSNSGVSVTGATATTLTIGFFSPGVYTISFTCFTTTGGIGVAVAGGVTQSNGLAASGTSAAGTFYIVCTSNNGTLTLSVLTALTKWTVFANRISYLSNPFSP